MRIINTWMPLGCGGLSLGIVYIFYDLYHTHIRYGKLSPRARSPAISPVLFLLVWRRSEDFKQLHLWLVWGLSAVPSLTQVVHCYLACGWYFPQPFTLGLHFSHSLALSACVPLRGLIGRLSHRERETGRDISHAELIACGGSGGGVVVWWNVRLMLVSLPGYGCKGSRCLCTALCPPCHLSL